MNFCTYQIKRRPNFGLLFYYICLSHIRRRSGKKHPGKEALLASLLLREECVTTPGAFFMSSHEEQITEIFSKFKEKFPPAGSLEDSSLQLTTSQIWQSLSSLDPELLFTTDDDAFNIFSFLRNEGYIYEPMEYNEEVQFKWLLKRS
jgi:hypothetical protein